MGLPAEAPEIVVDEPRSWSVAAGGPDIVVSGLWLLESRARFVSSRVADVITADEALADSGSVSVRRIALEFVDVRTGAGVVEATSVGLVVPLRPDWFRTKQTTAVERRRSPNSYGGHTSVRLRSGTPSKQTIDT